MPLETATLINDLVNTNPAATDGIVQGDDHIRLLKTTLKATFPNITAPVTATAAQLNAVTTDVAALGTAKYDKAGGSISGAVTVASGGLTVTAGGATITAGGLTVTAGLISFPTISETVQSTSEIATQAEANAGTDDVRIVSPKKLTELVPATVTLDQANDKAWIADASDAGKLKLALIPAGSSGEVNTAANVGTGATVFKDKVAANLNFKSFLLSISNATSGSGSILDNTTLAGSWSNNTNDLTLNLTLTRFRSSGGVGVGL